MCVCVFVYVRLWVGGWMDGYVFLVHSRPACACKCSRRGHYSILMPAWLHLGGQWDSDLSTRRTTADGWTPTSLSRLVLFTVLMFLCFFLWLQECYSVCEYKCSSQSVFVCPYPFSVMCAFYVCAWCHSAKVGCSQQHPLLMHHLTDWQHGLSSRVLMATSISVLIYQDSESWNTTDPRSQTCTPPEPTLHCEGSVWNRLHIIRVSSQSVFLQCNKVDRSQS